MSTSRRIEPHFGGLPDSVLRLLGIDLPTLRDLVHRAQDRIVAEEASLSDNILVERIGDEARSDSERLQAVEGAVRRGLPGALPPLRRLIEDYDSGRLTRPLAFRAAQGVLALGEDVDREWVRSLAAGSSRVALVALGALMEVGDPAAVAILLGLFHTPLSPIRPAFVALALKLRFDRDEGLLALASGLSGAEASAFAEAQIAFRAVPMERRDESFRNWVETALESQATGADPSRLLDLLALLAGTPRPQHLDSRLYLRLLRDSRGGHFAVEPPQECSVAEAATWVVAQWLHAEFSDTLAFFAGGRESRGVLRQRVERELSVPAESGG